MKTLAENNLIRFIKVTKKKEGMFAHFKAKGIKNGTSFNATIDVDIAAAEVDPGDTLEKIIEECARIAVKEFRTSDLQFEGLGAI